jgi:hypothetical protein
MDTLEDRVAKLERENRRWKRGAVLVLAVLSGLVLMGQTPRPRVSDEVRTRSLVIVDQAGKERAALSAFKEGPRLSLWDEAGNERVALYANKDEGHLSLRDQVGNERASLQGGKDGAALFLQDEAGKEQVSLYAGKEGPRLLLDDAEGYTATLGATELVTPSTGTKVKRSAASLVLTDKERKTIWQAPQ